MVVSIKKETDEVQLQNLVEWLKSLNLEIHRSEGEFETVHGLVGGSLARALSESGKHEIYGFDINRSSILAAKLVGAIKDELNEKTISECDIIFVALYPKDTVEYICNHAPLIKKGAIVADCGGVKRTVCDPCDSPQRRYGQQNSGKVGFIMKTVRVSASKEYDVIIGSGIINSLGENCVELFGKCRAIVITDSNVAPLWLDKAVSSLKAAGIDVVSFVFPAGEESKNKETLFEILEFMAENRLTRTDFAVALGGGVTGDITGLAFSLYLRGIGFVQVPTTLLAAVDSSVGGKTAVNLTAGKNLMGVFAQPSLVLCDTNTLGTLSEDVFADGMAEVIKYGVIFDKELFDNVKNGISDILEDIIARCVELKRDVVAKDEFDKGDRQLLNFGHTMAHSIEKCSNFEISHGKAVAIGMVIAAKASYTLGWSEENCTEEIIEANKNNNLPCECNYSPEELFDAALSDKKRAGDTITFVVPKKTGECILKKISVNVLKEIAKLK
ncbi:MAG: 3-dehydroquinate synthase [Clostridia bacterium]|nr:3-dehydroquinate synthase [Clostridia bacterium]